MNKVFLPLGLLLLTMLTSVAVHAGRPVFHLSIVNHQFEPLILEIPRGQKIKLIVNNQDATPEEFESYELNREKIIPGNSEGVVFLGPLKAGEYPFFGEFHMDTAQGKILVK